MGSGKGNPERWVAVVKPGRILFELRYNDPVVAKEAIDRAIQKLPIKAKFVDPGGGTLMARAKTDAAELDDGQPRSRPWPRPSRSCSTSASSTSPASSRTPPRSARRAKEIARLKTELRAREIAAAEALANEENGLMADDTTAAVDTARPNARKVREGLVTSTSMDKTAVVAVTDRKRHPRYNKTVQRTTKPVRPRRGQRPQRRRPGPRPGDPPALEAEALAPPRSPGGGAR